MSANPLLSRRSLLRSGAGGAVAIYATQLAVLETDAMAAVLQPGLRRSSWLALEDSTVAFTSGGITIAGELTAVADLPIADRISALQGHDAAFVLRFRADAELPAGIATVRPSTGAPIKLLLTQVGTADELEAVIDRTVRVAGVNEEGTPDVVSVQAARAAAPAEGAASATTLRRPRLRAAAVKRGRGGRRSSITLDLSDTRDVVAVRVSLLSNRGKLVGKAFSVARRPHQLRLRLAHRGRFSPKPHRVAVRFTLRDGSILTSRRSVTPR